MARDADYGAFMEKFVSKPSPSAQGLPLSGLTFAVKDIFDMDGRVTGFGNPDWARTHSAATSTAPAVLAVLRGGAICVGKTITDEMAYSINGENKHYGTPTNPCAPDRVPGGSSSGSAVAVGAKLVDFSLGTDTGGSVRVPASYCGILGFRPSHNAISTAGVIPMAQSFDTVGWFARDPLILKQVGSVLLQLPDIKPAQPNRIIIAEDCFRLSSIPNDRLSEAFVKSVKKLFGGGILKHLALGELVKNEVPSLNHFMSKEIGDQGYNIPSLAALSSALLLHQRYEFKNNHGEWVTTVKPDLGPGISEQVWEAVRTTGEHIDRCQAVAAELRTFLTNLLGGAAIVQYLASHPWICLKGIPCHKKIITICRQDFGVLAIPTVPGPPPKLQTDATTLETFCARAFSLLSIAGLSRFCQVSIPLGMYDDLPVAVSLIATHGSDGFLLNVVETLYGTLQEQWF